jgi:hypothetical protein
VNEAPGLTFSSLVLLILSQANYGKEFNFGQGNLQGEELDSLKRALETKADSLRASYLLNKKSCRFPLVFNPVFDTY